MISLTSTSISINNELIKNSTINKMKKKTVYISIEIKVREFISQIFLSSLLIKNGYRVYLGSKNQIFNLINKKKNKGGIFFYKAGVAKKYVNLVNSKTEKHSVLDQELLPGILNGKAAKSYYLKNINPFVVNAEKFCDAYFASNKLIFDCAKKGLRKLRGKVYNTGSPRIDLWKKKYHYLYDSEVKKIRKKYGNFLLFNSDYQYVTGNIDKEVSWYFFNPRDIKEWSGGKYKDVIKNQYKLANHKHNEFVKFVPFIKNLSKVTKKRIVIRPHPSENKFVWKKIFSKEKNIFIEDPIKDVFPWILASDGLLHRGCTTSLQSLMIGKPTFFIDLGKEFKENYKYKIFSYQNSIKIKKNFDKNIFNNFKNKKNTVNTKKTFLNYIGVDLKEESVKKIVKIFNSFEIKEEEKFDFSSQNNFIKFEQFYYSLKKILYQIYMVISFTQKIQRSDLGKYEKIYGGITAKEVKFYLKKFNKKNSKVENVINDVVMIEKL